MNNINTESIANGRVPDNDGYIPVVIGHRKNNTSIENIFFDGGLWRVYTNIEQTIRIRFYKCVK